MTYYKTAFEDEVRLRLEQIELGLDSKPELPLQAALDEMKAKHEPEDAERYEAITGTIDRTGFALTMDDDMPDKAKLKAWIDTLQWALEHLPARYSTARKGIQAAIKNPQHEDYTL